jgi:putative transposase
MSRQKKPQSNSAYTSAPLSGGKKRAKSKQSKHLQVSEDMMSSHIQLSLDLFALPSSTPEFLVAPSKAISTGKLQPSLTSTPTPKSSAKLVADSILKEKSFLPYWNESCKELSDVLLSPTRIDLQDLALTCSNGSANKTGAKSWFSMKQVCLQKPKWLKTSLQSCESWRGNNSSANLTSTVSVQGSTVCENTSLRCRKIQIYPSAELSRKWKQWNAACRYVYNQAISYQKTHGRTGKLKLRNLIMQSDLPQWVKDTPCHIKQNAIFEAHLAYKASSGCKFRSCRAPSQTIKFNDCNYSSGTWYPHLTKGLTFTASEPVPQQCDGGTQLVKCKGKWFAIFPEAVAITPNHRCQVIALDPGVRTFLTGYDGEKFLDFGNGDMGRITRYAVQLDNLMSRKAKSISRRQRQKMSIAAGRMRTKIQNLINEAHKQIACYLTQNYGTIFLPTFETSQMVQKKRRKIRSKTARSMLTWAHYRFKLFLKQKAHLNGCTVMDVTEEYTSKTCTSCGHIHQRLGGAKTFKCPHCGHTLPRDMNGALGIMLKALSDTT